MQPSRIIKSAHRRAGIHSLKAFAAQHMHDDSELGRACKAWLNNKAKTFAEVRRGR